MKTALKSNVHLQLEFRKQKSSFHNKKSNEEKNILFQFSYVREGI